MAVRPLVAANHPVLRQRAQRVMSFGDALQSLIDDMIETMRANEGAGLAAPQIGIPARVVVVELPQGERQEEAEEAKLYVLCNPEIVRRQGEEEEVEGCLSLPGFAGEVPRATAVTVRAQDREGKPIRIEAQGLLARAFQHEIDHLQGRLYIDRVESPDKIWSIEPADESEVGPSGSDR
jgi:peptide deformylase